MLNIFSTNNSTHFQESFLHLNIYFIFILQIYPTKIKVSWSCVCVCKQQSHPAFSMSRRVFFSVRKKEDENCSKFQDNKFHKINRVQQKKSSGERKINFGHKKDYRAKKKSFMLTILYSNNRKVINNPECVLQKIQNHKLNCLKEQLILSETVVVEREEQVR